MTIKKAIEHLVWKYQNKWNPTQADADALNTIMKFVEDHHKKQIQDYQLFAKLYIMVYAQQLEHYKTTVFDDIPKRVMKGYLDKPVTYFIELFTKRLNESERYSLFEEIGIELGTHPAIKSEIDKENETNILQNALKDKDNLDRFKGEIWDYETVKDCIEMDINNVINELR